jgi:hypothetical protein
VPGLIDCTIAHTLTPNGLPSCSVVEGRQGKVKAPVLGGTSASYRLSVMPVNRVRGRQERFGNENVNVWRLQSTSCCNARRIVVAVKVIL